MGMQIAMGASLQCTCGTAPSTLVVLPANMVMGMVPFATVMDNIPATNIPPFGTCISMTNPGVISATASNNGVLTPQTCTPTPAGPWAPGAPTVMIGNMPALNDASKLTCSLGGSISITNPGQMQVQVP